jgi:H+/Cl- antiporter ClcA
MLSIPHTFAGVAGGIFNSSLQAGVVLGLSIATGAALLQPPMSNDLLTAPTTLHV